MDKQNIILNILLIILILLSGFMGYNYHDSIFNIFNKPSQLDSSPLFIDPFCSGSLEEISNCMFNDVKSFYKYNRSNIGKSLTDEQLKEEGGVCLNWAEYYARHGSSYGLNVQVIQTIRINETLTHAFAVISNQEGYCIMEQDLKPYCVPLIT